jgi:hypothetical protein
VVEWSWRCALRRTTPWGVELHTGSDAAEIAPFDELVHGAARAHSVAGQWGHSCPVEAAQEVPAPGI